MELHRILFNKIMMGDCEDPELYAAEPLYQWQISEQGQWCMENSIDTPWYTVRPDGYGFGVSIYGTLTEKDLVYFQLKWANYGKVNQTN